MKRPGQFLLPTLLLSLVMQTCIWFLPIQAAWFAAALAYVGLPLEKMLFYSKNISARILYSFENFLFVVGFLYTCYFFSQSAVSKPLCRNIIGKQVLSALGAGAVLSVISFGLWVELSVGIVHVDRIDLIEIICPALGLGAGILAATALRTALLLSD